MEVDKVQGETVFKTSMAGALAGTGRHVESAMRRAPQSVERNEVKLSPESERWLSPSGHAPLRPIGDAPQVAPSGWPPSQAEPVAPAAGAALLDACRLEEFLGIDDSRRSLTRELMSLFLVEAAAALRDIDLALASRNCCELARSAHAFKALAGNVGAVGVVTICKLLEAHASRGRLSEAREQLWRLHLVWGQTRSAVEAWC